jgi:hypothetical protein
VSSIPASTDGDDGEFGLEDDASKDNFATKLRLAALACRFNTRSQASKGRTKATVESLLLDWCAGAKADLQFWTDAHLIIMLLN